jgi:hypothetical protein
MRKAVRFRAAFSLEEDGSLQQTEIHFDGSFHGHGLAVLLAG